MGGCSGWSSQPSAPVPGVELRNDLRTAPKELSIFTTEGYYRGDACRLRRFTLRLDGFVSANAQLNGGELITRPFIFRWRRPEPEHGHLGGRLGARRDPGRRRQGAEGAHPARLRRDLRGLPGAHGHLEGAADVSRLAGRPVRLRFALSDADLYSLQFTALPN